MRKIIGVLLLGLGLAGCTGDPGVAPPIINPPEYPPPPMAGPPFGAPVSGGNLLVTHDGKFAVAADPDRDHIYTVDLATHELVGNVALAAHDEPGRLIEDAAGRIHVALRRGGALVTLSAANGPIVFRREVCPEPRGVAYDASTDLVHVACTGGELVSFPASGAAEVRRLRLDRDLRDVVVVGDKLMITRLRTAEVITVDAGGAVVERTKSPEVLRNFFSPFDGTFAQVTSGPETAFRAVPLPGGNGLVMAHQRARNAPLSIEQGGYGGDECNGTPIEPTATKFVAGSAPVAGSRLRLTALPADIAISPDGQRLAFAMVGDQSVRVVSASILDGDKDPCQEPPPTEDNVLFQSMGMPSSVAFTPAGDLLVYYPDQRYIAAFHVPASLSAQWTTRLPGRNNNDQGRAVFHQMTAAGLACAGCHWEARDDGHTWEFRGIGQRRTQNISGHILQRAPYHWDGDMTDLSKLMTEVFVGRMGGQSLADWQIKAVGAWLDTIPAPAAPAPLDLAAVERGKTLFMTSAGCASCHSGAIFTNNLRADVGTGGMFKVPSLLGIGARAPFLHTGCAATLRDRFTCGGGDLHGLTSQLNEGQIGDLVAYLETL